MSITRNFFLGRELMRKIGPIKLLDVQEMNEQAREALKDIGIHIRSPKEKVGKLSGGERQSIAIGRARHFGAKLLILDEPTSALSVGETHKVLTYTQNAKERGLIGHLYHPQRWPRLPGGRSLHHHPAWSSGRQLHPG